MKKIPIPIQMCNIILLYKVLEDYPVILLHSRYMESSTKEIHPKNIDTGIYCPTDLTSGGTWVGFSEKMLLVAVTNQETLWNKSPNKSRGQLIMGLLRNYAGAKDAMGYLVEPGVKDSYRYGNFVVVDLDSAWHIVWDRITKAWELEQGIHVVTTLTLIPEIEWTERAERVWSNAERRRIRCYRLLNGFKPKNIEDAVDMLKKVSKDHGEDKGRASICYHNDQDNWRQTSSTIFAVARVINESRIFYCKGNPCENNYKDYSWILE